MENHAIDLDIIDTTYFSFSVENKVNLNILKSALESKVKKLSVSEHKYIAVEHGKTNKKSSIVCSAIYNKPELCFSKKNCYRIRNLEHFSNSIFEINYVKVEGHNTNLGGFRFEADIEELIFYASSDAEVLVNYINHVRNIEYFWKSLDKSPSDIFRENNKLYFIRMRNKHAKIYPQNISALLRN